MHGTRSWLTAILVVFATVSGLAAAVLYQTRDRHLGVHEDHFDKGVLLHETGSMSMGSRPMVFRPPGYPAFVAAALAVRDAAFTLAGPFGVERPQGGRLITAQAAQAVLLGVLGAAIFGFARPLAGTVVAAACAVAAACNPLMLVIAGHVSYELLHIVLVTLASLLLLQHAGAAAPGGLVMFGNGAIWGAATLVKSVTLVAPAFVLPWAALHYGARHAMRTTAWFVAGLLVVVAPYTARNYAVTGRFIPVNEQASFALWGTTFERIPQDARYLSWLDLWWRAGMQTYTDTTGETNYMPAVFEDHVLELSDRFARMAGEQLGRNPGVYAANAAHNAWMFLVDPPTSFWWPEYWPPEARAARIVAGLSAGLMIAISTIATLFGCVRRDPRWTLILTLFVMMWLVHALTFLEPRYLYSKLPTIIAGFVLACAVAASDGRPGWRKGAISVATAAALLSIVGLFAL